MSEISLCHAVGDYVSYKQNGICKILRIVKQDFCYLGEREYYELSFVFDPKSVVFVPVDSPLVNDMRHILSKDEIDTVIARGPKIDCQWIEDIKERARVFGEIIEGEDRGRILCVIKMLSLYKRELEEKKKKLYASDARLLSLAEKIICEEFSFVLGIPKGDVMSYITEKLDK